MKHIFGYILTFFMGFYIIGTGLVTTKFFYDMYYADAFLIKVEPDKFVEAVAQSPYQFETEADGKLALRLKRGK